MNFFDVIEMLANFATAIGIIFVLVDLRKDIKRRKEDKDHEIKIETIEAYSRLQNEALDALYINYTVDSIKQLVENRFKPGYKEEYRKLSTYIARIEHFCVGVEREIYDKRIVYKLAHGFFDGTIKDLIMPVLNIKDAYLDGNYYKHVRNVYKWMEEEKNNHV